MLLPGARTQAAEDHLTIRNKMKSFFEDTAKKVGESSQLFELETSGVQCVYSPQAQLAHRHHDHQDHNDHPPLPPTHSPPPPPPPIHHRFTTTDPSTYCHHELVDTD
jgi:hypothetical protein